MSRNFVELPKYVAALQASNPDTVVKWFHNHNSSSQAFGPTIKAFHLCRPVISIDSAHLKGSYKGKLFIVVSKCCAFHLCRPLCVLSDRHKGIIHAMENLEEWKEPLAYHRFCLRQVRSNLMKRYKNVSLKKICWSMGARQLPIRACIDLTLNRIVQLFRKHSVIAMNCIRPLPKCLWHLFLKRDTRAQSHVLFEFHYNECVYRIVTRSQINGTRGNTQTVNYFQHMCTCGKWQIESFPCSHALAVCRNRGDNPHSFVTNVYTTMTYRQQYNFGFVPLSHVDYWLDQTG
uniref:SWIM-type domain-containing protein n=1 Tax=Lactuca sativa TaxID=4236 RepID=A0A9R1V5P5_LACSA|nr:hypothetical protein LSAT_V11C600325490 [Lactuca sativa]